MPNRKARFSLCPDLRRKWVVFWIANKKWSSGIGSSIDVSSTYRLSQENTLLYPDINDLNDLKFWLTTNLAQHFERTRRRQFKVQSKWNRKQASNECLSPSCQTKSNSWTKTRLCKWTGKQVKSRHSSYMVVWNIVEKWARLRVMK